MFEVFRYLKTHWRRALALGIWSSRIFGMVVALVIAVVIMLRISALVTIVGIIPVIVLVYLTGPLGAKIRAYWQDAREAS